MIEKLNSHYSFTNPATVHDEEALTTLELVGRTTAKVNEVADDQNSLRTETAIKMNLQDTKIEQRLSEQDTKIEHVRSVEIPENITEEVLEHIQNGTFEQEINFYAGGLSERVDSLVGAMKQGSTTMDAEIIDARVGADGKNYSSLGSAIRSQLTAKGKTLKECVYNESVNLYNHNLQKNNTISPYYYVDGVPLNNESMNYLHDIYDCSALFEIEELTTYTIGLVPAFGVQSLPWYEASYGMHFYDAGGNFIGGSSTGTFTTPAGTKFARFNIYTAGGLNLARLNKYCMLVRGDKLPEVYTPFNSYLLSEKVNELDEAMTILNNYINPTSSNLYNPLQQTSETIDDSYYVDGHPYTTADGSSQDIVDAINYAYDCTAPIQVEPSTTYTLALVPAYNGINIPWNQAGYGVHMYDSEGNYVEMTAEQTFTTPSNVTQIRFNIYTEGIPFEVINSRCMLVEGSRIPDTYEPFIKEGFSFANYKAPKMFYCASGDEIIINSHYNSTEDLCVELRKHKTGNNIFDFHKFGLISNTGMFPSNHVSADEYFMENETDMHSPFIMRAVNNGNGDTPDTAYFTGGAHQTNNSNSGGAVTGRTSSVKFYADNKEVNGSGYCDVIRIEWTNLIQGYNTTKANGNGREILQENHILEFDGITWKSHVELVPLEDIVINTYYGLQCICTNTHYKNIKYVGGTNRKVNSGMGVSSSSGSLDTTEMIAYGDKHKLIMGIDITCDLGKRTMQNEATKGMFVESYGKGYCGIIKGDNTMKAGDHYHLKGYYKFISL